MNKVILHIDFNSYFATVEQQANPRLRGKPIAVTGGDRLTRTVVGAASVEAKKLGVRTGMSMGEALKICPDLVLVKGDSDKYLACTKVFLNILKDYSPYMEIFSIDEVFLELGFGNSRVGDVLSMSSPVLVSGMLASDDNTLRFHYAVEIAMQIKQRIKKEVGEWITVSIGISYNKFMAKLAGSLYKPDGLVVIEDNIAAMRVLDTRELDDVCGIGFRIKKRLNNMGVFSFADLRQVPLSSLLASFKSYGQKLYDMARGDDFSEIVPFYEKEEVKSIGHRHTTSKDISAQVEIKQLFLKLTELVARKLRQKKLVGKTVSVWYRSAFNLQFYQQTGIKFIGDGMQLTIAHTDDGLKIFLAAWEGFMKLWDRGAIRMVGVSISNLQPKNPSTICFLDEEKRQETIVKALDKINDKYGEFTLKRAILINTGVIRRKPNSFLADYRFRLKGN